MLLSIFVSGCIVVADPDDVFLYDFGLTGEWGCVNLGSGGSSDLTITNLSGYTITSGKYYVGATEPPDWSLITENLNFEEFPLTTTNSKILTIDTATADIIVPGDTAIWIKLNSGSDYLIGAFYYVSGDSWDLIVYTKN